MTITTPRGVKIRCTSKRRYYVIREMIFRGDWAADVMFRSDDLATARRRADREDGENVRVSVFDSVTRTYVARGVF